MRRLSLSIALFAALVLSAPAQAQPTPSPDAFDFQARAVKMAELRWHPQCGKLVLSWETPPPWEDGTGWAYAGECVVHLNADKWELGYWEALCTTVLHEAGHIAGREHTAHGLMRGERVYSVTEGKATRTSRSRGAAESEWQTFVGGGDWRCERGGRPWLRAQLTATRRHRP